MTEIWNDLIYTDVMQSNGYVVDYAVLTTYSLDMHSLVAIPFLLGTMCDLSDAATSSPHIVLEAINESADKFVVFCNAGCIAVPQKNSKIYALLEESIIQILPKGKGFVNFHPKVWIIKETNPVTHNSQIKVVVLSRNLTCSNDLDVVCELIGKIENKEAAYNAQIKHKPLTDFLNWLSGQSHNKTRKKINKIIKALRCVEHFELAGSPFDDYDFFPMGIDGYNGIKQCLESDMLKNAAEMVVISPFIDKKTLSMMSACNPRASKTLITRHSSVNNEIIELFNDGIYAPKEVLTDKSEKDISVDLHEKVYFIRNNKTGRNNLYLGSTNSTQNGFDRNIEFLLRLTFAPRKSSYNSFRNELIYDSKECMFEKIESVVPDDAIKEDTTNELLLRQAIAAITDAKVNKQGQNYTITVYSIASELPQQSIIIYPFGCEAKKCKLSNVVTFTDIDVSMLTMLYVINVGDIKRLIKIKTTGLPIDERNKAVFRSIINTKSRFINYIAFMLTSDVEQYILESRQLENELFEHNNGTKEKEISISLYEDMVRTAYHNPERIASIRSVMQKAHPAVIPECFTQMYAVFEKAIKQIKSL